MSELQDPCKIGILHPAYSVGKRILLLWINTNYDLSYTKVEQCATAALYCQVLDSVYPGDIAMGKVKWNSKNSPDWEKNWKIVQKCLTKKGISKEFPVQTLLKAKFQDNLETLQWFRYFAEYSYKNQPYDAKGRRKKGKGTGPITLVHSVAGLTGGKTQQPKVIHPVSTTLTKTASKKKKPLKKRAVNNVIDIRPSESEEETKKLQLTVEAVEKERNFYFAKLREIEILIQETQVEDAKEFKNNILAIMYRTDEEGDMVVPDEGDENPGNANENETQSANGDDATF